MMSTALLNNFSHPCIVVDELVGVWAGMIMDMFVEVGVVVDSLIDVVTNEFARVSTIDMFAANIGVFNVEIIVVAVMVIDFEFAVSASCAVAVLPDMLIGVLFDVLAGVLAGVMICIVVIGIGVDALAVVNVSVLTAV